MGANLTSRDLTTMQAAFARGVANGADPKAAALLAGYSSERIADTTGELLRAPSILAAIHHDLRRRLIVGAPVALSVIERLVKDDTTPPKIRLDAAKTLLDRAGFIAPRAVNESKAHELSLNEMSLEDLRGLADKLESELATRAKPVSSANSATAEPQAIDIA